MRLSFLRYGYECEGSEIIFNSDGITVNLNRKWIQFMEQVPVSSLSNLKTAYDNTMSEGEDIVAVFIKNFFADDIIVDIAEYTEDTDKRAEFNSRRYARRVLFFL